MDALRQDETIEELQEAAADLIADLHDGDISREDAGRRKDEIIAEIDSLMATLADGDGRITTIDT